MLLRNRRSLVDPASRYSEPFRLLRLTVEARNGARSSNVTLFTSPGLGQGKSTVAANYAASLAGAGRRVLLVDGDLRRPVLHTVCDVPRTPGLVDVLADELPLEAAVHAVRGVRGLHVLAPGAAPSTAPEFVD
jgi:Mrp family chromosome partitioning ATPase